MKDIFASKLNKYSKILLALPFILITINCLIINSIPPASGYEPSIYWSLPLIFWIIFLVNIFFGITLIVLSSFYSNSNKNSKLIKHYWKFGLLIIFLCYLVLLFLPTIRGYFMGVTPSWDCIYHMGTANSILVNGNFFSDNSMYLMTNIILVLFSFCGLSSSFSANFYPAYFSLLLILFLFVLGKTVSTTPRGAYLILAFSVPLLYGMTHIIIQPSIYAAFFIALSLYLYIKGSKELNLHSNYKYVIIFFIVGVFIIFFHPLTSIFFLILIILLICFDLLFGMKGSKPTFMAACLNRYGSSGFFSKDGWRKKWTIPIFFLIIGSFLIIWIYWNISMPSTTLPINIIYSKIFSSQTEYMSTGTQVIVDSMNQNTEYWTYSRLFESFIKYNGYYVIPLVLGLLCLIYVLVQILIYHKYDYYGILLSCIFLFGILICLIQFTGMFIIQEYIRMLIIALLIVPIFTGYILFQIISNMKDDRRKFFLIFFIIVLIFIVAFLGMFRVYMDAWFGDKNAQFTYMDKSGLDWVLDNNPKDARGVSRNEIPLVLNKMDVARYLKYHSSYSNNRPFELFSSNQYFGSNFGYNYNSILGTISKYDLQFMITYGKMKYTLSNVPLERYWRFSDMIFEPSDFYHLNIDPTVSKIYNNGEFNDWIIRSSRIGGG